MKKPVFLIGFMGSGKTTWGKKMANAMNIPFIDIDHVIADKVGMSIPEYFSLHGEEAFRKLEKEVLFEQKEQTAIISTGGGTPCYFDNMDWILQNGIAVYLQHSPKSLWARLSKSNVQKRPSLKGFTGTQLFDFIEQKLAERSIYYDRAHITVDQINTPLEQLVSKVREFDEKHT